MTDLRFAATRTIAYFSMEIGLDAAMPTYSGGLGVLAGDTVRSAADLRVPMVAVTLLYRKGYFYQRLDPSGWQREEPALWVVEDFLTELPDRDKTGYFATVRSTEQSERPPTSITSSRYVQVPGGGASPTPWSITWPQVPVASMLATSVVQALGTRQSRRLRR